METFLQLLGEEALRTLPLTIAFAVIYVLIAIYLIYAGATATEPGAQKEKVIGGVALLVVGIVLVSWTWSETAELCRDSRGTDFWSEHKCHIVDPEGHPLRQEPFDLTP